MSKQYKPYSGFDIDQKRLPDETLNQLYEDSRMHNGRILLLDLDETLIHAKYVNDKKNATFKLKMPEQDLELLVSTLLLNKMSNF